jgi:hypothetical protein
MRPRKAKQRVVASILRLIPDDLSDNGVLKEACRSLIVELGVGCSRNSGIEGFKKKKKPPGFAYLFLHAVTRYAKAHDIDLRGFLTKFLLDDKSLARHAYAGGLPYDDLIRLRTRGLRDYYTHVRRMGLYAVKTVHLFPAIVPKYERRVMLQRYRMKHGHKPTEGEHEGWVTYRDGSWTKQRWNGMVKPEHDPALVPLPPFDPRRIELG